MSQERTRTPGPLGVLPPAQRKDVPEQLEDSELKVWSEIRYLEECQLCKPCFLGLPSLRLWGRWPGEDGQGWASGYFCCIDSRHQGSREQDGEEGAGLVTPEVEVWDSQSWDLECPRSNMASLSLSFWGGSFLGTLSGTPGLLLALHTFLILGGLGEPYGAPGIGLRSAECKAQAPRALLSPAPAPWALLLGGLEATEPPEREKQCWGVGVCRSSEGPWGWSRDSPSPCGSLLKPWEVLLGDSGKCGSQGP